MKKRKGKEIGYKMKPDISVKILHGLAGILRTFVLPAKNIIKRVSVRLG